MKEKLEEEKLFEHLPKISYKYEYKTLLAIINDFNNTTTNNNVILNELKVALDFTKNHYVISKYKNFYKKLFWKSIFFKKDAFSMFQNLIEKINSWNLNIYKDKTIYRKLQKEKINCVVIFDTLSNYLKEKKINDHYNFNIFNFKKYFLKNNLNFWEKLKSFTKKENFWEKFSEIFKRKENRRFFFTMKSFLENIDLYLNKRFEEYFVKINNYKQCIRLKCKKIWLKTEINSDGLCMECFDKDLQKSDFRSFYKRKSGKKFYFQK